jgi:hypothetical protein
MNQNSQEDAGDIKNSKRRVADANRKAWQRQLENLAPDFYTETALDRIEWIWRLPQ